MSEHKRKRTLLTLLLGLLLGAMLLLAGGLPNLRFQPGRSLNLLDWFLSQLVSENATGFPEITIEPGRSSFLPELGEGLLKSIIIFFWLMLIFSIVYAIISPKLRRELVRMFALILVLVVILPQIAKNLTQLHETAAMEGLPGFSLGENTFPVPPPFIQDPPGWFFAIVNVLLMLVFFGGIYFMWRRLRPNSEAHAVVVKEVKRALSDLEAGLEMKDVVIACYAKMCQGLQESRHIKRKQAMTPREFENHLAHAGIANTHIQQLTRLFEGVRYGAKPTDKAAEHEAKQCLQAILQVYSEQQTT